MQRDEVTRVRRDKRNGQFCPRAVCLCCSLPHLLVKRAVRNCRKWITPLKKSACRLRGRNSRLRVCSPSVDDPADRAQTARGVGSTEDKGSDLRAGREGVSKPDRDH